MTTYKSLHTPIIKPRVQGGTFYTFASALEDIGLNINELRNKVTISHYALLDLPEFDSSSKFDTLSKTDFANSEVSNIGDYKFAEGFQNYVLNMETVVRNQENYNFTESKTVSERIFWKWLQKSCLHLQKDPSSDYYLDSSLTVKGFGQIVSGSQRSDNYGLYNETFVQIPSSFGQMKCLFKKSSDSNYYARYEGYAASNTDGLIENVDLTEIDGSGNLPTGITAKAIYDHAADPSSKTYGYYTVNDTDDVCLELDIDNLRKYYNDQTLTFDDLAIDTDTESFISDSYSFNAVLIYYSIYDSTNKNIIATNAYGILLLDSARTSNTYSDEETPLYLFPELIKTKSTATTSGTSYSFRLNIKTTSVYSGDIAITDNATAAYSMSTDFNEVIRNLSTAIDIIKSNANYLRTISSDNTNIKELAITAIDKVDSLSTDINNLKSGLFNKLDTSTLLCNIATIDNLYTGIKFVDEQGEEYGKISKDVLNYQNIETNNINISDTAAISNVMLQTITSNNDASIVIKDSEDNIYSVFTNSGMFANKLYTLNTEAEDSKEITKEAIIDLFENIQVRYSATTKIYTLVLPSEDKLSNTMAKDLLKGLYYESDGKQYLIISSLVMLYTMYYTLLQTSQTPADLDKRVTTLENTINQMLVYTEVK
jgi:hypothetical protein